MTTKSPQMNYLAPPSLAQVIHSIFSGPVDLDPCAHPQQFVMAAHHCYGGAGVDDGIEYDWSNKTVFLNPNNGEHRPVDKETREPLVLNFAWHPLSKWVSKAAISSKMGATVVALLPSCTDNKRWFHTYIPEASAVVLLKERVKSWVPNDEVSFKHNHDDKPKPTRQPSQAHLLAIWTQNPLHHGRFIHFTDGMGIPIEFNAPAGYDPEEFENLEPYSS